MSALAQNLPGEFEVIIVDDASQDSISWDDDPRVRVIRHPVNLGAAEARNTGVRAARGEFIAFLDSDDIWEQGKLANQLEVLRSGSADLIGAFTSYAFEGSPGRRLGATAEVTDWFRFFLDGCRTGPGSTLMFRRSRFEAIGDQDPQLPRFEDWDWLLRAARLGSFAVVPGPGALLTLSGRPSLASVLACADYIYEKWRGSLSHGELAQFRAALDLERAAAALWNRHYWKIPGYLAQALLHDPAVIMREGKRRASAKLRPVAAPT